MTNQPNNPSATQDAKQQKEAHIQIDRTPYTVPDQAMTGAQIRQIPTPPIGPDRDLFEVVPGATDLKIQDTDVVQLHNGQRVFTAPGQINPGLSFATL
ncbi:MAG: multiubiquitin domain-containing protein, partial [Candidatus Woesebacteria bacterium]|nr:multiubiquitin domain-containing protein [Candidatus Woesebacteria bacterium]